MFTLSEKKKAVDFFEILKTEAIHFTPAVSWIVNDDIICISTPDGYELTISVKDCQHVVKTNLKDHKEKDFLDCLVRVRFELLKNLNPAAFA